MNGIPRCTTGNPSHLPLCPHPPNHQPHQGTNDFLAKIARSIGRLKKGSVPDYNMAAIHVLRDWTDGSIPYYTLPPEVSMMGWGEELNLFR